MITPSNTTNHLQPVDDNRGKTFRNFTFEDFNEWLEDFDWESNPQGKIPLKQRRILTAKFAQHAYLRMNTAEQQKFTVDAMERCGLRMELNSNFDKIVPVRFPKDFGLSLLPGHPLYGDIAPYLPLISIDHRGTTVASSTGPGSSVDGVAEGPGSAVGSTVEGEVATVSAVGPRATVTASGNYVARARASVPHVINPVMMEQVDIFDGDEDRERRRVFLFDEIDDEDDDDSDDEVVTLVARRRLCLPGCDCERDRGRKCGCEKRDDGLCAEECECDRSKCRARPGKDVSDDEKD